jgi:hypothetical protein
MKVKEKIRIAISHAILLSAMMLILGCPNHASRTNGNPQSLQNGIYAVLREGSTPEQARVDGAQDVILAYDRNKYTDVAYEQPITYAAIDPNSYVPLVLEGPPETVKEAGGKSILLVSLERENAKKLEDFTREHLGGKVATIVDGEIISMNKVRAVIVGGKLQMTRCADNACEIIRAKLVK